MKMGTNGDLLIFKFGRESIRLHYVSELRTMKLGPMIMFDITYIEILRYI